MRLCLASTAGSELKSRSEANLSQEGPPNNWGCPESLGEEQEGKGVMECLLCACQATKLSLGLQGRGEEPPALAVSSVKALRGRHGGELPGN